MARVSDIQELARREGRFDIEAYHFVSQSLRHAAKRHGKETAPPGTDRHLSAGQLVEGILDLAVDRFGLLADLVLRGWGLRSSEDIGSVTFALIEHGVFTKQPTDRIEDFLAGPEFVSVIRQRVDIRLRRRCAGLHRS